MMATMFYLAIYLVISSTQAWPIYYPYEGGLAPQSPWQSFGQGPYNYAHGSPYQPNYGLALYALGPIVPSNPALNYGSEYPMQPSPSRNFGYDTFDHNPGMHFQRDLPFNGGYVSEGVQPEVGFKNLKNERYDGNVPSKERGTPKKRSISTLDSLRHNGYFHFLSKRNVKIKPKKSNKEKTENDKDPKETEKEAEGKSKEKIHVDNKTNKNDKKAKIRDKKHEKEDKKEKEEKGSKENEGGKENDTIDEDNDKKHGQKENKNDKKKIDHKHSKQNKVKENDMTKENNKKINKEGSKENDKTDKREKAKDKKVSKEIKKEKKVNDKKKKKDKKKEKKSNKKEQGEEKK